MDPKQILTKSLLTISILLLLSSPLSLVSIVTGHTDFGQSPLSGTLNVAVLLIEFSDKKHTTSVEDIQNNVFVNVNNYWREVSYNKLSITGEITKKWYVVENTYAYFAVEETSTKKMQLIEQAINSAGGEIDMREYPYAIIVHAGDDEGRSMNKSDMWSYASIGRGSVRTNKWGTLTIGIALVAELDPIGVICHEMGHNFGLPDLWNYDVTKTSTPWADDFVGEWDLMAHGMWANGGSTPSHPSSWCKMVLGWIDETQIAEVSLEYSKDVGINPLESGTGTLAVKIPLSTSTYYLIEVRRKTGFDSALPDEGVLIFLVDESRGNGDGILRYMKPADSMNEAWEAERFYTDAENGVAVGILLQDKNFAFTLTFRFGLSSASYSLTVITPQEGVKVTIDGGLHQTNSSKQVTVRDLAFGEHVVEVESPIQDTNDTRTVFSQWDDGDTNNPRTILLDSNKTLTASYKTQYFLQIESEGEVTGEGWYDSDSVAKFKVSNATMSSGNSTRLTFQGWFGDYEGKELSSSIKMDKPKKITAEWKRQYLLTINSKFGAPTGQGWYDENTTAEVSVQTPVETGEGVRQAFIRWSGDMESKNATNTVLMDGPKRLSVEWQEQHQVIVTFIDSNNREVTSPQPSLKMLSDEQKRADLTSGNVWLDSGNYTLEEAKWCDVMVGKVGSRYATGPNVKWIIPLEIYSVNITVRSSITGLPVKGAGVVVKLPNGESFNATTDEGGVAMVPQLPVGSGCNGVAAWQGISERFTFDVLGGNVEATVRIPVLTEIIIIVIVVFGVIGFIGYSKVFRPKVAEPRVSKHPIAMQAEEETVAEKPEEESLETWYELEATKKKR